MNSRSIRLVFTGLQPEAVLSFSLFLTRNGFLALASDNILITVILQSPSSLCRSEAEGELRSLSFSCTAAEEGMKGDGKY